MSCDRVKDRRRVVSVEEMTHYTEICTSIITKASAQTLGFAVSGPSNRRCRFWYRPRVNVRKDDCDLISPAVSEIRYTLKHGGRGKEGEGSGRHDPKCHGDMPITHS